MKDIIAKGKIIICSVYLLIGVFFGISIFFNKTGNINYAIYTCVFCILSFAVLVFIGGRRDWPEWIFRIAATLFVEISLFGVYMFWHETFIIFTVMLLQWLACISFLKPAHFSFLAITQTCFLIIISVYPFEFADAQRLSVAQLIVIAAFLGLANWISRNIVHTLIEINEENLEQERSLDDMLSIVEAKHIEAKNATKSKSRFLSNMSHEIRTPINTILGMNEMIMRESETQNISSYARNIKSAGNMLLSIINDILDTSKIESGKIELILSEYSLNNMLNDVLNMTRPKMREKKLDFDIDIDTSLPIGYIGDDMKLRQILINLLTNAAKYTVTGYVLLIVRGEVKDDKAVLSFKVKDTGIGIKTEDLKKLADTFVRIEEKRNKAVEGTGLGLSIVCNYLKLMDSSLKVVSEYGNGSEFFFEIEQKITDMTHVGNISGEVINVNDEEYSSEFTAPDAKILVVDDNNMNLFVITELLKETEMTLDTAISGKICLDMTAKNKYDLIFMDHMMPGMDGIETLHAMREDENNLNRETPVVALTANAVSGARQMYMSEGFDDFITKPVVPEKLEKMIKTIIPDDKIMKGKKIDKKDAGSDENIPDFAGFPSIEGLDYNFGWMHLHDMDLYIKTIKDMIKTMKSDEEYIRDCYNKICEGSNEYLDQYRIKIHSMKNSTSLIGLVPLSGAAALLEYAARDNRIDMIKETTQHFLNEWKRYYENMKEAFSEDDAMQEKLVMDTDVISDYLKLLLEYVQNFDVNGIDDAMEHLRKYIYSDEVSILFDDVEAAVTEFDSQKLEELILRIKDYL